jgi:hypothetical protein
MAVATAIAIGGLAISAATTTMSFAQASSQKGKQRRAEAEAAKAMAEARKKLEINFTDKLAINKETYELQRDAMLSAGAQAIQAGVESERGSETTAGKVLMAQNEAQAGIRTDMGKDLMAIQEKQVAEQSRLRDLNVQLDLGEVEGAQQAAADAERAAAQSTSEGFQGVSSTLQQGLAMVPLYQKTQSAKAFGKIEQGMKAGGVAQQDYQNMIQGLSTKAGYGNLAGVGVMKADKFSDYMSGLPASQLRDIFGQLYPKQP